MRIHFGAPYVGPKPWPKGYDWPRFGWGHFVNETSRKRVGSFAVVAGRTINIRYA